MSQGKDHTGLGALRIPIFFAMALFMFSEAIQSFRRVVAGTPTEIIAKSNMTLITQESHGLVPNGNLVLEIMFGILMLIAGIVLSIGLAVGILARKS